MRKLTLLIALCLSCELSPAMVTTNLCGNGIAAEAEWTEENLLSAILQRFKPWGAMVTSIPYDHAVGAGQITYEKFHWVRDSAIVSNVVQRAARSIGNPHYKDQVWAQTDHFFSFSRKLQMTQNRSGGPADGGLGETRFMLDGQVDRSDWAFPQNDGPALRAVAAATFADDLLLRDQKSMVRHRLFDGKLPTETVMKADVEYVAHHWWQPCFDLWEERKGHHFFTRLAQRRALWDGMNLANHLDDEGAANVYLQEVEKIERALESHWSESEGYLVATVTDVGQVDYPILDASSLMGVVMSGIPGRAFSVSSDKVMATAAKLEEFSEQKYEINKNTVDKFGQAMAPAIGRNPQDRYDGHNPLGESGNPWVLTTAYFGEYYFRLAKELKAEGTLTITKTSLPFFRRLFPEIQTGLVSPELFQKINVRLHERGHEFLRRVRFHFPQGIKNLNEQIHRVSGEPYGAPSLTWSLAAYLSAILESYP